ncbi:hypothetical protein FDP41_005823 [Naegleria fowleri]|uniref:Bromo domain-containing protein n=1 Tax=Naegleria fowleri TaxID=5763 RepID=A0A6A5BM30_NAEFO|nr:uncharacterized protein FDP41_005823 [Naegleria fowleri]KAF0975070.1 hypothetical protein FDP41_005823 [Naegleria fowleri]
MNTTSELIPNDTNVSTNDLALLDLYLNEKQKLGSDDEKTIYSALNKSSKIYLEKKYPSRGIKKEIKDLIGDQKIETVYQELIKKRLNFLELVERKLSNCINFIEKHQDEDLNMKIIEQFINSFEFITPAKEFQDPSSQKKRKSNITEEELEHSETSTSEKIASSQQSKQKPATEQEEPVAEKSKKKRKFTGKVQKDDTLENTSSDATQQLLCSVLKSIEEEDISESFLEPVDKNIANYYESILCPISIADIKKKVKNGEITSVAELKRNLFLMFQNCIMFSGADFDIHHEAKQLRNLARTLCSEAEKKEKLLKQN